MDVLPFYFHRERIVIVARADRIDREDEPIANIAVSARKCACNIEHACVSFIERLVAEFSLELVLSNDQIDLKVARIARADHPYHLACCRIAARRIAHDLHFNQAAIFDGRVVLTEREDIVRNARITRNDHPEGLSNLISPDNMLICPGKDLHDTC